MHSDQLLIERLQRDDRDAFEEIVQAHQRAIHGYLRARVIPGSEADDLTQDVFLRFYQSRARFDSANLIRPWLLGIARNLLREHLRQLKRRKEVGWTELCLELEDLLTNRSEDLPDDSLQYLPQCLAELGQSAQAAIQMRYTAQMPLVEIGEKLKRSEGAVKLLMFRARQALKYCLDLKLKPR